MISYPGDILSRFGRYEAVEDLGASGTAHLWGAWDPYLERFVLVVALPEIDPRAFFDGMRDSAVALEHWTAHRLGADDLVLDCSPGTDGGTVFLVVAIADDDAAKELAEDGAADDDASPVEPKRR